ncbi:20910_t:CDS:2, partial [Gigaspora margarita]
SSAIHKDGMDRTHIVALAKNILHFTSTLAMHISIPDKCLEKYLVNGEARCPNKDCNRNIETFLSPKLFKRSQDKPTTSTAEDIATKQVDSENPTPIGEDADAIYMNELGLLGREDLLSKTAEVAKETSDQATSSIEIVSTTPGNSEKLDDLISKITSSQIQLPICEKYSEEISLEFTKPTIFLLCKHVVHYDCIKDSHKMCPTCPSSETMSEVVSFANTDLNDVQKKHTRKLSIEKSSSKKVKKTGGKKVSSTIKQLIEELLTDIPDGGRSLEETSYPTNTGGVFWKLSNRIDSAESKNEDASHGARALVKSEVRKEIPKAKFSDDALKKRIERARKMFKIFNTIGKEKIARVKSILPGENPYDNAFAVEIDTTKLVSFFRDAIKEKIDNNVRAKDLKLWKVDISLEEENKKFELVNTKINVNIEEELEGVELKPLSKISKHFPFQPADEHIHIIIQRPVETKEVHCTATYRHGTKDEHIIINHESGKECIRLVDDEDLASQQPFSSWKFDKMKTLFGLKADDYNELPTFVGVASIYGGEIKVYPQYEISGSHGKGPVDWAIKIGNIIITITKVKREDINQGIAQNAIQTSIQRNPKKRSYNMAYLHEDVMYGIVSTAMDWVIIKLASSNSENNNSEGRVEVLLSSLSPSLLPINKAILTHNDLVEPIKDLFEQIKWVFDSQIESQKLLKR